ncbi:hypothetical protein MMC13_004447 [Lambiella insularis]|nr:hypothetical protein [Lambiella insularis]
MDAVEYEELNWQNEFRQPSIYRGPPTLERERAWDELWNHGDMNIPEDKMRLLNRSLQTSWKRTPAKFGGGIEAAAEVFHQLHCLNMIRQYTWLDAYATPPPGLDRSPEMSRTHVDHCIETIRRALMCVGDVTPVLVKLDPKAPLGAQAEFSTFHKCRKFDKLVDWMKENVAVP